MSKTTRNFLFSFFVALFLAGATLILPDAFGYQLNWRDWRLQKTGLFDIKTTPGGAVVYLNGQAQKNLWSKLPGRQAVQLTTPTKIKNLTPGEYELRLELDGYWPWSKRLSIKPNETTYLEDVYFFKKNAPRWLAAPAAAIQNPQLSPDKKLVAAVSGRQLQIFTWDAAVKPLIITLPENAARTLNWSPSSKLVLTNRQLLNLNDQSSTDLGAAAGSDSFNFKWGENDNQFLYQNRNGLNFWDKKTDQRRLVVKRPAQTVFSDYLLKDGYLYLITKSSLSDLSVINFADGREAAEIKLPSVADYRFSNTTSRWLNLYDPDKQKLYLLDIKLSGAKDYQLKELSPLTLSYWIDDNRLLYANDFEIWLWDRSDERAKLLTRVSQRLTGLAWHHSNNYIIFTTADSINSLELDDRNGRNITQLLDWKKIDRPLINDTGTQIFFVDSSSEQNGFYLLEI